MNHSMPGLPVHHHLPEFTQTQVHRVGDAFQSSHPLSSPFPPASNPSQHQSLFQWVNSSCPKYWSFSFSIIPSKEQPELISFRTDWLDLVHLNLEDSLPLSVHYLESSEEYRPIFWRNILYSGWVWFPVWTSGTHSSTDESSLVL